MMRRRWLLGLTLLLSMVVGAQGQAGATMSEFVSYTAEGAGLSIDALGVRTNRIGTLDVQLPAGASVYKAYLYSASVWRYGLHNVEFEGNTMVSNASSRLDIGSKDANPAAENRWDVTSIVSSKVGGGSGLFHFSTRELGYLDGEILAVLYEVPSAPVSTAMIFDGELASSGDSFKINLAKPIDKTDPNFQATMSLGISFGYQPGGQYTEVDVNGKRLTSSAGGQDDGYDSNGGLITAGGIGDSVTNPPDPYSHGTGPRYDDELYDLSAFVSNGDTVINIATRNPSNNDNIFFMGFTTLGKAYVGPGPAVPEPTSLILLGTGLMGMMGVRQKKRKV